MARIRIQRTAAHAHTIDPALFFLGSFAKRQGRGPRRLRRRQGDMGGKPHLADIADTGFTCAVGQGQTGPYAPRPQIFRRHGPGRGVFFPGAVLAVGMPPAFPGRIPALRGCCRIARIQRQHVEVVVVIAELAQGGMADPAALARAAPGGGDQSHRHMHMLAQFAGEEVAAGGEITGGLRRLHFPRHRRGEAGERCGAGHPVHRQFAHRAIGGGGDLELGIAGAAYAELHVGLAGAKEDVTHQHVTDDLALATAAGLQDVRPACCHGGKAGAPMAVLAGLGRHLAIADLHGDIRARTGRAINRNGLVPLQHRVIGKHGMEQGIGKGR